MTDDTRKELDESNQKDRDKLPLCPKCKTNNDVIPTVRGKPSSELLAYANEGHVKLSGCTKSYNGWCKNCQQYL